MWIKQHPSSNRPLSFWRNTQPCRIGFWNMLGLLFLSNIWTWLNSFKDAFVGSSNLGDAENTSTCKLTENDDGILVLEHGLDKCGTTMEYKTETQQIVFTVSNVVNFQGNSPCIVVIFLRNFLEPINSSIDDLWKFYYNFCTNQLEFPMHLFNQHWHLFGRDFYGWISNDWRFFS